MAKSVQLDLTSERQRLPIFPARDALIRAFRSNICCLVIGETGSGKTTQIPQVIINTHCVVTKRVFYYCFPLYYVAVFV